MKKEYDFSKAKKNPYSKLLKKQITIRLEEEIIEYFKKLSDEMNIPYQNLINMYLTDCVNNKRKLKMEWI